MLCLCKWFSNKEKHIYVEWEPSNAIGSTIRRWQLPHGCGEYSEVTKQKSKRCTKFEFKNDAQKVKSAYKGYETVRLKEPKSDAVSGWKDQEISRKTQGEKPVQGLKGRDDVWTLFHKLVRC